MLQYQIMLGSNKVELSTFCICINKEDFHRCLDWEAIDKVSRYVLCDIEQTAPWARIAYLFDILVHAWPEISLANFVECPVGIKMAANGV